MVDRSTVLVPRPDARRTRDGVVVEDRAVALSPTAALVWDALDGAGDLGSVVDALQRAFPSGGEDVERDVLRLGAALLGEGLVTERRPAAGSTAPSDPRPPVAVEQTELPWTLAGWVRGGPAPSMAAVDGERWAMALRELRRSHLVGVLAAAVTATGQDLGPARQAELDRVLGHQAQATQQIESCLVAVHDRLVAAGIEHRVLKGVALAALDHPDERWRPTGDLDLLVGRDELLHAAAVLEAAGAARLAGPRSARHDVRYVKAVTEVFTDPRVEVDLHAELVAGPFGTWMDSRRCFEAARHFERQGRRLPALALEDALVHACLVALVGNRDLRPSAFLDLLALVDQRPDPVRVWDLARTWRVGSVVTAAATLAAQRFPGDAAALRRWQAAPYPLPPLERLVLRLERAPGRRYPVREALTTLLQPTWADRLGYGAALAFPVGQRSPAAVAARVRRVGADLVRARRG